MRITPLLLNSTPRPPPPSPNPRRVVGKAQPPLQPGQQRVVGRRRPDPLDQPLHRRLRRHLLEAAAKGVDRVELIRAEELLLPSSPARRDVDRRIDALLGERAI